jgi:hypothetical protein
MRPASKNVPSVGTVIKYKKYPHGNDGKVKDYWFIVLGKSSVFNTPICYHLFKTTAQTQYYLPGAERAGRCHKFLGQKAFPFFDCDCCIDFDFPPESRFNTSDIQNLIDDERIEIMGRI